MQHAEPIQTHMDVVELWIFCAFGSHAKCKRDVKPTPQVLFHSGATLTLPLAFLKKSLYVYLLIKNYSFSQYAISLDAPP